MYLKKLLTATVVFMLLTLIVPSYLATENTGSEESHLIEDVPYSYQSDYGCLYASLDMLFKYHGKNSSMLKNMFYNGVGYAYAFDMKLESLIKLPINQEPIDFNFYPSHVICQGGKDLHFLASLYGINLSLNHQESVVFNHIKAWNDWWENVKEIIKQDIPVLTAIDPCAWPIYYELFNKTRPMPGRSGHAIVLVGFNESNKTICVQDPMAGADEYYNPDRIGYQWIDEKDFKIAMARSYWEFSENSYSYSYVTDTFETPNFDDAFRAAHERNIERLKGNIEVYDETFTNYYKTFGIDAIRSLRDKYDSPLIFIKYPIYRIIAKITKNMGENAYPFGWSSGWIYRAGSVTEAMAGLLTEYRSELTDENLTQICDYESKLFTNISEGFFELDILLENLQDCLYNHSLMRFSKIKEVKDEIVNELDHLIEMHEEILAGPEGI